MAKLSKSISFKNAEIDTVKDQIVETTKDDTKFFTLSKILADFNGISGISFVIKTDTELDSDEDINEGNDE